MDPYFVMPPEGEDAWWYVRKRDWAPEPNVEVATFSSVFIPNAGDWAQRLCDELNTQALQPK